MRYLIFANGILHNSAELQILLKQSDFIIAADGGANHCFSLAITPDILIGDLDSIKPAILANCQTQKVEIHRYPTRKDATDLELALDLTFARGADSIWLLGALGGRLDMSLGNILLAASEKYNRLQISFLDQDCFIHILHPDKPFTVKGFSGQKVSLLPLEGDVSGLTLSGFEYSLTNFTIPFGSTLGISNILLADHGSIRFSRGTLLCTLFLKQEPR